MAEDLRAERARASFPVREMTFLWDGGRDTTERRERMRQLVQREPLMRNENRYFLSRVEAYRNSMAMVRRLEELKRQHAKSEEDAHLLRAAVPEYLATDLHDHVFIECIRGQASEEQAARILPLAMRKVIIGAYAQTELAHGSNVMGLQTTFTFIRETDEFEVHTPSLEAIKWWPGCMGRTANHVVAFGRLIVDGKDLGIHAFLVQIRKFEDHSMCAGIEVGDIGPKFGANCNDNGYLRFNRVRIPRTNMLMRYASLDRQGNYKPSPHAKLGYGTMVLVRSNIVYMSSIALAKAVTIAVRYSAQRRQFALGGGDAETPVLDYAMQQHRLLPLVAAAYAFRVTAFTVRELYIELSEALKKHDTSLLPEMHATSAGLKSLVTTLVGAGIDECRQCCGGHGYSRLSGLPDLFADFLPNQTAEGDNYLLSQQVGRYLLKAAQSVVAGKPLAGGVRYLERGQALLDERCAPDADLRDPEVLVALFRHRVARLLFALAEQMQLLIGGGASAAEAWNQSLVDVWRLSCAHGMETIVSSFASTVRSAAPSLQQVLRRLLALFALAHVEREQGDWLEDGYLREAHCRRVRVEVRALLTELRPDAVALVDAFNFSDVDLGSAIGSTDGYAYRKLYEAAQREPLNQTPVDSGFMQYVHPLISSRL